MKCFQSIILLCALLLSFVANADNGEQRTKFEQLSAIYKNIKHLENAIDNKRKKIQTEKIRDIKADSVKKLQALKQKRDVSKKQFLEIAADIDTKQISEAKITKKKDLLAEIQDLLSPAINGLKRISERPRKIEKLRFQIEEAEIYLASLYKSHENLSRLLENKEFLPLHEELSFAKQHLNSLIQEQEFEKESKQNSLSRELEQKRTLLESAQDLLQTFFETKGKNLLFALLGLLIVFFSLYLLKKQIFKLAAFDGQLAPFRKPLQAFYNLISFLLAILGGVFCLYILNDWILVTIAVLLISGVLWSSKQFLPQFVDEIKLIFNLGPVRENERIFWNGIPWKVSKLSLYSILENDSLQGGRIRISAKELLKCHSRQFSNEEPWFPTKQGDWILLGEDDIGEVLSQSPEQVIIQKPGGNLCFFSAQEFMNKSFDNLSSGFTIIIQPRLTYELQESIVDSAIPTLKSEMAKAFPDMKDIIVELKDCDLNSLNLWIRIDCPGEMASQYRHIKRKISQVFVSTCNREGFKIPVQQMAVQLSNSNLS